MILSCFLSNMQKLQGSFFCSNFLIGASCHHGHIWRYLWKLGPSSFKSSLDHDWSIVCNIFINVVSYIFIKRIKGRVHYMRLGGLTMQCIHNIFICYQRHYNLGGWVGKGNSCKYQPHVYYNALIGPYWHCNLGGLQLGR